MPPDHDKVFGVKSVPFRRLTTDPWRVEFISREPLPPGEELEVQVTFGAGQVQSSNGGTGEGVPAVLTFSLIFVGIILFIVIVYSLTSGILGSGGGGFADGGGGGGGGDGGGGGGGGG